MSERQTGESRGDPAPKIQRSYDPRVEGSTATFPVTNTPTQILPRLGADVRQPHDATVEITISEPICEAEVVVVLLRVLVEECRDTDERIEKESALSGTVFLHYQSPDAKVYPVRVAVAIKISV